jgi:hypothetical protein
MLKNLLQTKFKSGLKTFRNMQIFFNDILNNSGAFELCGFSLFVVYEARKRPRERLVTKCIHVKY